MSPAEEAIRAELVALDGDYCHDHHDMPMPSVEVLRATTCQRCGGHVLRPTRPTPVDWEFRRMMFMAVRQGN